MPSSYAHYVFGKEVLRLLPEELASAVQSRRQLFDIGLHGPDILFYYHPLTANAVNSVGFGLHAKPASVFFGPASRAYAASTDRSSAAAYLLGFVCHFALDSACHGYIEKKISVSAVTHTEIESEFDRYLLQKEGREPLSARLTGHICPTAENARVIAPFFNGITEKQVQKSLRSMLFYNELMRAPHAPKRLLVNAVLKLTGNYKEMHGMMMAKKPIGICADSDLRLEKLMHAAESRAASLCAGYYRYLNGSAPLDPAFDNTFGPAENWREIPVFSLEEEKRYEI